MRLIKFNIILLIGLVISGCNGERNKVEKELSYLTQRLDSLKMNFTELDGELWPNEYASKDKIKTGVIYRSPYEGDKKLTISYVKQNEEGIIAYIDTTGEFTLEIHKNLSMNPSSSTGEYFQYYDVQSQSWKYVLSLVTAFRREIIGDSTFIKQALLHTELSPIAKANLEAHALDTNGIRLDPSGIKTEQIIGIFKSGSIYTKRNNVDETDLDEFINDLGEQIKNNPSNEAIIINYGYYAGRVDKDNNYVLNEKDKKTLYQAYELYKTFNLVIACRKKLAKVK